MGCRQTAITMDGFDIDKWSKDKNGCENIRSTMISLLEEQKEHLLAHTEMEIVTYLGNPDVNEISKRNQKFYYYYLQPASGCAQALETPLRLSIRFNAMGLAKEVIIE
jgi:predicted  nucleic acid-binding Zn ribbon protein